MLAVNGGMEAKQKQEKTWRFFGSKPKAQAGWPKRLGLVRTISRAEVDVIDAQLLSSEHICARAIFPFFYFFVVLPPHSWRANYIRNAQRCAVIGKPGSAQLEGTLTMDLELKGIRTHM